MVDAPKEYHLSEFVFPICELRREASDELRVHRFHGTGFSIGESGYFLSAHRVTLGAPSDAL
jgi:hypothetical protein